LPRGLRAQLINFNRFNNINEDICSNLPAFTTMNLKSAPNHKVYLEVLKKMSPAERLEKAFQLSKMTKQLFLEGLRKRFPEKNEMEIRSIYLKRIEKCYNRNY
jgi:hypothetical protein